MAPASKSLSEEEHSKAVAAFQKLGVCEQLAEAAAALGWKSPSSIQEQAVPLVLQGEKAGIPGEWPHRQAGTGILMEQRWLPSSRPPLPLHTLDRQCGCCCAPSSYCADKDVIGLAQTGSGKTGAFAMPILQVCAGWIGCGNPYARLHASRCSRLHISLRLKFYPVLLVSCGCLPDKLQALCLESG